MFVTNLDNHEKSFIDDKAVIDSVPLSSLALSPKHLYVAAINSEEYPSYLGSLEILFSSLINRCKNIDFDPVFSDIRELKAIRDNLLNNVREVNVFVNRSDKEMANLITEYAPEILAPASWLQGFSQLVWSDNMIGVVTQELINAYLKIFDGSILGESNFRILFKKYIGEDVSNIDMSFLVNYDISLIAFENALSGLSLGHCAEQFSVEVIGYSLWKCYIGIPIFYYDILGPEFSDDQCFDEIERFTEQLFDAACSLTELDDKVFTNRVLDGFRVAHLTHLNWRHNLQNIQSSENANARMFKLVKDKIKYAQGYHKNVLVDGQSIDGYFSEDEGELSQFLKKLKSSRYINIKCPHLSSLLTESNTHDGKMSGIFSKKELQIIKEWISDDSEFSVVESSPLLGEYSNSLDVESYNNASYSYFSDMNIRELTYYIANRGRHSLIFPTINKCAEFVTNKLHELRMLTEQEGNSVPYSSAHLEILVEKNRLIHTAMFEKDQAPFLDGDLLKTKYLSSYSTFCTDGCWLDGSFQPSMMHCEEFKLLFNIYRDELGAGNLEANHNFIARKLFKSMGIDFPQLSKEEFFTGNSIPSDFMVPFIQYSLSSLFRSYLPEILGLNLTMETNGVSWGYRRSSAELRRSGFSSQYMDLHMTIDNYSSGHGYQAKRAIISYMDSAAKYGHKHQQLIWERVLDGYLGMRNLMEKGHLQDVKEITGLIRDFTLRNSF